MAPEGVNALTAAIKAFVADPERRAILGAEGRAFAELHLSPASVLGRLDDRLRSMCGQRAGERSAQRAEAQMMGTLNPEATASNGILAGNGVVEQVASHVDHAAKRTGLKIH